MVEKKTLNVKDNQGIKLLEKYLPVLSKQNRAYLKGISEALLYVQEGICVTKVEQSVSDTCNVKDHLRTIT
jgi:hypothetical protein